MRSVWLESTFLIKALESWWNTSQWHPGQTEVILPFYSAWARAHLECCAQVLAAQNKREIGIVKKAQRRATKMLKKVAALMIEVETDHLALRWKILWGDDIINVYSI